MTDTAPARFASGGLEDLSPEPATPSGLLVGYGRVSTAGQNLDRQRRALETAGCAKVFLDIGSGRDAARPELTAARAYLRPGDALVVPSLDRLSRSLADLITLVAELRRAGVEVPVAARGARHHHPGWAVGVPRLRRPSRVHPRAHRRRHPRRPRRRPRPWHPPRTAPAMSAEQIHHARDLLTRPDNTVTAIARLLGVSRSTLYRHLPELSPRHSTPQTIEAPR